MTTPLADDLSSTEEGRCPIPTGRAPIEGISDDAVHVEGRMVRVASFQQMEGQLLCRWIWGIRGRFG